MQLFQLQLLTDRPNLCQYFRWIVADHLFLYNRNLKSVEQFSDSSSHTVPIDVNVPPICIPNYEQLRYSFASHQHVQWSVIVPASTVMETSHP